MKQTLETFQKEFARALISPEPGARPGGLSRKAGEGFGVYRNNYFAGQRDRLGDIFPVAAKVLGKKEFQKAALAFAANKPPKARTFSGLGEGFPDFLAGFSPWISDLARLELAVHRALFAPDAPALDPKTLTGLGENILAAAFRPHPAASLLELAYPVVEIWRAGGKASPREPERDPLCILLTRPEFRVGALALKPGEAAFAAALMAGETSAKAAARAQKAAKSFDPGKAFQKLLSAGAFAG